MREAGHLAVRDALLHAFIQVSHHQQRLHVAHGPTRLHPQGRDHGLQCLRDPALADEHADQLAFGSPVYDQPRAAASPRKPFDVNGRATPSDPPTAVAH